MYTINKPFFNQSKTIQIFTNYIQTEKNFKDFENFRQVTGYVSPDLIHTFSQ